MSQHEVSEFIVVAPATMGKAIQWAEPQLIQYLEGHFPLYRFRVEPFGPLADYDNFTVIPIMNRPARPGERTDKDQIFLAHLNPTVIPEIRHVLKSFDPAQQKAH